MARTHLSRDERGFTLIEMIVVLVVLALVVSIVIARGPMHSARLDLRACARGMAAEMRTMRARAIATDRDLAFTVDPVRRDYGAKGGARHALPAAITLVGMPSPILFHADGSATAGRITLAEGDRRIDVRVDWLTGGVAVR